MTAAGWSLPAYEAIVRLVGERTGLLFAPRVHHSVESRIRKAMARRSLADLEQYLVAIVAEERAFEELLTELTIGETYFFREPAHFEYLRTKVIPDLLRERGPGCTVRAWSAGCATGEEAYSLAALLLELGVGDGAKVLGTDLSTERLRRARAATYSRWSLRGVPEELVRRYFRKEGPRYTLVPELTAAVKFQPLNLAEDSYPSLVSGVWEMDVILCRNVLIYLDYESIAAVAARLMSSLHPDGWLFLGASDPPLSALVPCEVVVTGNGVAYRRARRRSAPRHPLVPTAPRDRRPGQEPDAVPSPRRSEPPARRPELPSVAPAAEEGRASAAYAAYEARDYRRASEMAAKALEEEKADPGLWVLLVRALANSGRLAESGRACLTAMEHHRTSAELMYLHAVVLAEAGRHGEAAVAARRALYLDRGLAVAHMLLADMLLRLGDQPAARRSLRNAERLLDDLSPDVMVPGSDGERAGRLLEMARLRLKLVEDAA